MTDDGAGPAAGAWAAAYRRLALRLSHELRNPLNGAMVNVEVLRGRSAKPGLEAATLRSFAESASAELERAVSLVDALLALARSTPAPVDLEASLRPLVVVLDAIAAKSAGGVTLEGSAGSDEPILAPVDADGARVALALATEYALDAGQRVRCHLRNGRDGAELHVSGLGTTTSRLDEIPTRLTLFVRVTERDVLIRFPRPGAT